LKRFFFLTVSGTTVLIGLEKSREFGGRELSRVEFRTSCRDIQDFPPLALCKRRYRSPPPRRRGSLFLFLFFPSSPPLPLFGSDSTSPSSSTSSPAIRVLLLQPRRPCAPLPFCTTRVGNRWAPGFTLLPVTVASRALTGMCPSGLPNLRWIGQQPSLCSDAAEEFDHCSEGGYLWPTLGPLGSRLFLGFSLCGAPFWRPSSRPTPLCPFPFFFLFLFLFHNRGGEPEHRVG